MPGPEGAVSIRGEVRVDRDHTLGLNAIGRARTPARTEGRVQSPMIRSLSGVGATLSDANSPPAAHARNSEQS